MVNKIHYRWDFIGLSTDTKPTPADSPKVVNGSTFYCSDTSKLYVFYKDTWYERKPLGGGGGGGGTEYTAGDGIDITNDVISVDTETIQPKLTAGANITIDDDNVISAAGGGGVTELTSADYNWPTTGTKTTVALWLMDDGIYTNPNEVSVSSSLSHYNNTSKNGMYFVYESSGQKEITFIDYSSSNTRWENVNATTGEVIGGKRLPVGLDNNLTSTSDSRALTSNQGRILKDMIDNLPTGGEFKALTTADYNWPTANPDGIALWLLDSNGYTADGSVKVYTAADQSGTFTGLYLTKKTESDNDRGNVVFFDTNGNGIRKGITLSGAGYTSTFLTPPVIEQTTGTSTTHVMSQKAVTSMVFADPSTKYMVQIGTNAVTTGGGGIGIGYNAGAQSADSIALGVRTSTSTNAPGSIALGYGAKSTQQGQFDVSLDNLSDSTGYGYNNSNYRLLSGVYDGQSAHDAATVGQINATIDAINTALSTSIPHIGA